MKALGIGMSAIAAAVGLVTSTVTAVFLLKPNLEPTTTNKVQISAIAVEPSVTLGDYVRHPTVDRFLQQNSDAQREFTRLYSQKLDAVGTVVHFAFELTGYAGKAVSSRWTAFDAGTGRRVGESENRDPLETAIATTKRDADVGSWETWVNVDTPDPGASLIVRIELYEPNSGARLVFRDTPPFPAP